MIRVLMVTVALSLAGTPVVAKVVTEPESQTEAVQLGVLACIEKSAAQGLNDSRSSSKKLISFLTTAFQKDLCKTLLVSEEEMMVLIRAVGDSKARGVVEFQFEAGTAWVPYPFIAAQQIRQPEGAP